MRKLYFAGAGVVAAAVVLVLSMNADSQPGLSREMVRELGAANYVRDDVSLFSSARNVGPRLSSIWNSNAVQGLAQLPSIKPLIQQFNDQLDKIEFIKDGQPILKDAVDKEIFVCASRDLPDFVRTYQDFSYDINAENPEPMIRQLVANEAKLQIPPVMLGFKVTNKAAAEQFLDKWLAKVHPDETIQFTTEKIKGSNFHVLRLSGKSIPAVALKKLDAGLVRRNVSKESRDGLARFIESRKLVVAIGFLDGYLLCSIGKDTSMLEQWNTGHSLAESDPLRVYSTVRRPDLLGVSYASAELTALAQFDPERLQKFADKVVEGTSEKPELKARLHKDIAALAADLKKQFPPKKAQPAVSFSFANKGVETFTFQAPGSLDYSKPLTILQNRGKKPILCYARRGKSNPGPYELLPKWIGIGFQYFEDLAVPTMKPDDRAEFKRVTALLKPFAASLDKTTRENLIPAVDGTQSMLVLDGQGAIHAPADDDGPRRFRDESREAPTFSVPRVAYVIELNDPKKFTLAVQQYSDAIKTLLKGLNDGAKPQDMKLTFPRIKVSDVPGTGAKAEIAGKLYVWQPPMNMGADAVICALLKDRMLVVSSSTEFAKELIEPVPMPADEMMKPAEAAGSVTLIDGPPTRKLLGNIENMILAQLASRAADREEVRKLYEVGNEVAHALSTFKGYSSTSKEVDGRLVTHSWLHVEDTTE